MASMMASLPRIEVTAATLRSIVSEGLAETINLYRASRRQNGRQDDANSSGEPTEQEIDDFLFSNPLLDTETVQQLTDPGLLGYFANTAKTSDGWLGDFRVHVESWANSNSWLGGDAPLIHLEEFFGGIETDLWTPSEGLPPGWVESCPSYMLLAADLLRRGRLLSELPWRDFEKLVGELLEAEGWTVQVTQASRDGGVDIIAEKLDVITGALRTLWQAKRYGVTRKVKLHEVRELSAIVEIERATKGFIVTTSHLTSDALRWVKRDVFRLGYRDKEEMERWIRLRVFGPEW
jgi:restriction system protein